jgi:16S rRNA processing protein RimM
LITSAHGVRGEVRVSPLTDFPERFEAGARLWLQGRPVGVERSRWQRRDIIVKLAGVETRDEAEALHGKELQVIAAAPLEAGVFYQHDVIGLRAVTVAGEVLGTVVDVLTTGSADVYVVRGERGELLLPAVEDVVREIDLGSRRLTVELLEGLEFTRAPSRRARRPSGEERRLAGEAKAGD